MAKYAKRAAKTSVKKTTKKTTVAARNKTATTRKGVKKRQPTAMPTENQIRERAFDIFLARNGSPGNAHSDWMQAERDLCAEADG
ncbi:MAG: DUF2934 domain-containing protein [Phycisphaerae bacterium]|nr:DUF2934 domain-containing protein [Phycisphaerae bacterium]